jgi:hypothetical protein
MPGQTGGNFDEFFSGSDSDTEECEQKSSELEMTRENGNVN